MANSKLELEQHPELSNSKALNHFSVAILNAVKLNYSQYVTVNAVELTQ